jgi:hypothetical protein
MAQIKTHYSNDPIMAVPGLSVSPTAVECCTTRLGRIKGSTSVLSDFSLITDLVCASTTCTNVISTQLFGRTHRSTYYTDNDKLGPYYCYYA